MANTLTSKATTIKVTAAPTPGNSVLSKLAASMSPGTWAKLQNVSNQNAVLGVGNVSGTTLHYCNSMPWNPKSKVIEIIGSDHGYGGIRHMRYDDATNSFVLVAAFADIAPGHGYDHNAVNPYTGDLYHRNYGAFSGTISSSKKPLNGPFAKLPNVSGSEQVAIGACWWSGSFTPTGSTSAGSQGCFMIFNSGATNIYTTGGTATDGQIVAYDPLTNNWFYNKDSRAPFYSSYAYPDSGSTYHSVIEYSTKKNVAVYGGGNAAPTKLWKIDSNGNSTPVPNFPSSAQVGIQQGLITEDPATGNFLLLSNNKFWEFNPSTSAWTELTGSRTPPADLGKPGPQSLGTTPEGIICCPIHEYGVVVYITQINQNNGNFYVYKHA